LEMAGGVCVVTAGAAVARRGARQRGDPRRPALVEGRGAGDLDRGAPHAVHLAHHGRLEMERGVRVLPAGAHDTELIPAPPVLLRSAVPGTSIAVPSAAAGCAAPGPSPAGAAWRG